MEYKTEQEKIVNYLYKKHYKGWLGPGEEPADVLQDIKTKLLIELPEYAKQEGSFFSWADVIVKNYLAEKWRRDTSTKKRQSESSTAVSYIDGVGYEFNEDYTTPGVLEKNAARKNAGVPSKTKGRGGKYDPAGADYKKQMEEQEIENQKDNNPEGCNFDEKGKKIKSIKWTDEQKLRRLPAINSRGCECCRGPEFDTSGYDEGNLEYMEGLSKYDKRYIEEYEKEQACYKLRKQKNHIANWDFLNKCYPDLLRELNIKYKGSAAPSVLRAAFRGSYDAVCILADIKAGMIHGLNDRERHAVKMLIHGYEIKEISAVLGYFHHESTKRYLKKAIKKLINFVEGVKNGDQFSYTVIEGKGDQLFGYDDTVTVKDVNGKNKKISSCLIPKTKEPKETPETWQMKFTGLILRNVTQSGASQVKDLKKVPVNFKVISENDYYVYAQSLGEPGRGGGGYVECFERYALERGLIKYDLI